MQDSAEGISKKIQQKGKQVAGAKKKVNKELPVSFKSPIAKRKATLQMTSQEQQ